MEPTESVIGTLIRKYEGLAPRYTSYPPIPFWRPLDSGRVAHWLESEVERSLSIYAHIPFCRSQCLYCGCQTVISPRSKPVPAYLGALFEEIDLVSRLLGRRRTVRQLHLGGGTPTYLDATQLAALMDQIHLRFALEPDAEQSIEIDPRTVGLEDLGNLYGWGFNRISLGVQDFDPGVQSLVNRLQPAQNVARLTEAARRLGFRSVNFDLIYGLPGQTRASFAATLDQVLQIRPDRIALYPFAYLPGVFSHQRKISPETLPGANEKLAIFLDAQERLTAAGYAFIGMDHFALSGDDLTRSYREGTLQRNFMGYTTQAGSDLIGFGMSAISEVHGRYWQNEKRLSRYEARLSEGHLPVSRGVELSRDDRLRKDTISSLLCKGRADLDILGVEFGVDLWTYFASERRRLAEMEADGLVRMKGRTISVTDVGRLFLRGISQVFDAFAVQPAPEAVTFSSTG